MEINRAELLAALTDKDSHLLDFLKKVGRCVGLMRR